MFGKIIDGKLVVAGKKIQIENGWITNPTEEDLKANGYKEVSTTEKQSYDNESEKLVEKYTDNGKGIEITYEKVKLSEEEKENVLQMKTYEELNKVSQLEILKAIIGNKEAITKIEGVLKNISNIENKKGE